jgi:hypothetical protein
VIDYALYDVEYLRLILFVVEQCHVGMSWLVVYKQIFQLELVERQTCCHLLFLV